MSGIRITETTKLFYDKFLYKITIKHTLSNIFRSKNFTSSREFLDKLQTKYEQGKPLTYTHGWKQEKILPVEELRSAQVMLSQFTTTPSENFLLRIEGSRLSVYTNNFQWINHLLKKNLVITDLAKPSAFAVNNLQPNQIIMNKDFGYEFKVTLRDFVDPNFYKWLINNPDKVRIGSQALLNIERGNYTRGFYFFVKDSKVLNLINIMICKDIARIDNIITTHNIDK